MKTQLLIPAAGMGRRLGCDEPKALVKMAGIPLLAHTLRRFAGIGLLDGAVLVCSPDAMTAFQETLQRHFPAQRMNLVPGGAERQDSVWNGLEALDKDTGIVVIHDAARPFISPEPVRASIAAAAQFGAASVAIPVVDTIFQADAEAWLESTPPRERMWACQTPQTFRVEIIRDAHRRARAEGRSSTDDATLARWTGARVKLIPGSWLNFKVTTPEDFALAEAVLKDGLA